MALRSETERLPAGAGGLQRKHRCSWSVRAEGMGKPGEGGHGVAHGERKGLDYILMFSWDSYVAEVLEARKRKASSKWLVNSIRCPTGLFPP